MLDSFLIILFSLSAFSVSAAEVNEELNTVLNGNATSAVKFDTGINADSLLQVFIALISVVLIIFILSIVLKKFNMLAGGSSGLIKIIAGISLSSKDRLLLIQVGDEQILISASPGSINKVHELTTPVESEVILSSENPGKNSFSSLLNSLISRQR